MAPEKINTMNKVIAWVASSAFVILGFAFYLGGFVKETNTTTTNVHLLEKKVDGIDTKLDGFISFIKEKYRTDSIVKFAEKEAELKYKRELNKATQCVPAYQ